MFSGECHWTTLMWSQHWFRKWLGATRHQAIKWANVYPDLYHHMASLGHNELSTWKCISGMTPAVPCQHHKLPVQWAISMRIAHVKSRPVYMNPHQKQKIQSCQTSQWPLIWKIVGWILAGRLSCWLHQVPADVHCSDVFSALSHESESHRLHISNIAKGGKTEPAWVNWTPHVQFNETFSIHIYIIDSHWFICIKWIDYQTKIPQNHSISKESPELGMHINSNSFQEYNIHNVELYKDKFNKINPYTATSFNFISAELKSLLQMKCNSAKYFYLKKGHLVYSYIKIEILLCWWNFHYWLHWKLSWWQLPLLPVMKITSMWQHFYFSLRLSPILKSARWCIYASSIWSSFVNNLRLKPNGCHFADGVF